MKKILIIDDDIFELQPHADYLRSSGFSVDLIDNVSDIIDLLRAGPPRYDLCIVDLMMPTAARFRPEDVDEGRATGFMIVQLIREQLPSTPVAIITVRRDDDVRVRGDQLGVAAVIEKPCMPKELVDKVQYLLGRS